MNYLVNGDRAEPLEPGMTPGEVFNILVDDARTTNEPWDAFDISVRPSMGKAWLAFGLTIAGCAIAGLVTGVAVAALIGKRVFDAVT